MPVVVIGEVYFLKRIGKMQAFGQRNDHQQYIHQYTDEKYRNGNAGGQCGEVGHECHAHSDKGDDHQPDMSAGKQDSHNRKWREHAAMCGQRDA